MIMLSPGFIIIGLGNIWFVLLAEGIDEIPYPKNWITIWFNIWLILLGSIILGLYFQITFVSGILISDNILITQEIFHALWTNQGCQNKNMAIKTDMNKAYDRME